MDFPLIGNLSNKSANNLTLPKTGCIYDILNPACFPDGEYYPLQPFKLTTGKIVSSVGMALLIIVTLCGNVLVCTAFFYYRRLRTVPNYFIISLAASDIMVGALSMPLWLSYEVTEWQELPLWIDFDSLRKFWEGIDILSAISSISNLAAISIDRFFSIMTPLSHRTRMTPKIALCMVAVAWVYSLVIALCSIIQGFKHYAVLSAVLGFFVPLLIIMASYISIYVKVKTKCSFNGTIERDWSLARTLLIVISLFLACWMPFFLLSLTYTYCIKCTFDLTALPYVVSFVKWMHYLNSCCNPFVYGFFNVNFKQAFKALFSKCFALKPPDVEFTDLQSVEVEESSVFRGINLLKRKLSGRRSSQGTTVPPPEHVTSTTIVTGGTVIVSRPSSKIRDSHLSSNNSIQQSLENRRSGSSDDTQGTSSETRPLLVGSSTEQKSTAASKVRDTETRTPGSEKRAQAMEDSKNTSANPDEETTDGPLPPGEALPSYDAAIKLNLELENPEISNNNNSLASKVQDEDSEIDASRDDLDAIGLLNSKESCV